MSNKANNPNKKSWISVDDQSDFPIQNIPFGVFLTPSDVITIGTRIGDKAIDLAALHQLGYFKGIPLTDDIFLQDSLNDFISDGPKTWRLVRNRISELFDKENPELRDNPRRRNEVLFDLDEIEMQLPVQIGDYTDFYSNKDHMVNMETVFKSVHKEKIPKTLNFPLGYHGRSSSIVPSGIPIHRPYGQIFDEDKEELVLRPSEEVDFELEMAFITTDANVLGETISIEEAESYIFGMVLFNNWSARDIQRWEYIPPGSFLGKNFASAISPWIVTLDALQPFREKVGIQKPEPLPYLKSKNLYTYNINLEVLLTTPKGNTTIIARSNFKNTYWTMAQQLAHHTISGCKVNSGDLMASGTISGEDEKSMGSLSEMTQKGINTITLNDGSLRSYLNDEDTISIRGYCKEKKYRIGFGSVSNTLKSPYPMK